MIAQGLWFSDANSRWWTTPSPKIYAESDPSPFRTLRFRPISAPSAALVRAGEKIV